MGKIISICNQKGGVGKTTTAINLSSSLALKRKKVLLVDMDPLGNSTIGAGLDKDFVTSTIVDVLLNNKNIDDCIHNTQYGISIIPSSLDLAMIDPTLNGMNISKEEILKEKLDSIRKNFDYIIIDCPPSLGLLNTNSLVSSDSCIVPVQCEYYAVEGLMSLLSTIRKIQTSYNSELVIEGILLTMFDSRVKMNHDIALEVRNFFDECVFNTNIPRCVKIPMSQKKGKPVYFYDKNCSASNAYIKLAEELISKNG